MSDQVTSTTRSVAERLAPIVGERLRVLDDGFVRLVDYMGSDEAIVQAARVSYGAGTKRSQSDKSLIRYLMRHWHTTPFEMCELKLHVRVPMDTWRQWIRHRTASVNEYSTRYSIAIDSTAKTREEDWRLQTSSNRQGSEDAIEPGVGRRLSGQEQDLHRYVREVYDERLRLGVAREQARKDLCLSTYTEAFWKIDLHNLFHFLQLRLESHSQLEIRRYAELIGSEIVARWCPIAWQAFLDYRVSALVLSAHEQRLVRLLSQGAPESAVKLAQELRWLDDSGRPRRNRERLEFEEKASKLGISCPWIG